MVFVNLAGGWWWSGDGNDSVDLSLHQHPVLRLLLLHDQLQPRASVSDQLCCDSNYQCSTIRISTHESALTFWSQPDIKYHHQVKVKHKVQLYSSGDTSASIQLLVLVNENSISLSFSKNICRQHVKHGWVEEEDMIKALDDDTETVETGDTLTLPQATAPWILSLVKRSVAI